MDKDFTVSEMRAFLKSRIDSIKDNPTEVHTCKDESGKYVIESNPEMIKLTTTLGTLESLVETMNLK
jgi:hypothetical protein